MRAKQVRQGSALKAQCLRELRSLFADNPLPVTQTKLQKRRRSFDQAQLNDDLSSASSISASFSVSEACQRLSKRIADDLFETG